MYLRLKLGQMWTELSRYLKQNSITPLGVDTHLIAHMVQWHRSWGNLIEDCQRKLIATANRVDEVLEKDELARIRDCRLAPTLEALDDVDRIRRTTDRSYMLRKKDRQRRQVRAALSFPRDADTKRCHRTFSDKTNVTVKSRDLRNMGYFYKRNSIDVYVYSTNRYINNDMRQILTCFYFNCNDIRF